MSDVEICIVSYNSAEAIRLALASVAMTMPGSPVAICEHGSDPLALISLHAVIAESVVPIRLELDPTNPGFGAGCNRLAAGSTAEWLLFLNPDAEVLSWPWVDRAVGPSGSVIGPATMRPHGPGRHYGRSYSVAVEVGRSWLRLHGRRPVGTGFVSGAALLIERAVFERLGGFDADYFMFYEDLDLCRRANAAGVTTVLDDGWAVRHAGAHATSKRFDQSLLWSYESACRYHGVAGPGWSVYRCYVIADCALRGVVARVRRRPDARAAYAGLRRRATGDLRRRG